MHVYTRRTAHAQFVRDYLSKNVSRTPWIAVEFERRVESPVLMKVHSSREQELTSAAPLPGAGSRPILEKQDSPVLPKRVSVGARAGREHYVAI